MLFRSGSLHTLGGGAPQATLAPGATSHAPVANSFSPVPVDAISPHYRSRSVSRTALQEHSRRLTVNLSIMQEKARGLTAESQETWLDFCRAQTGSRRVVMTSAVAVVSVALLVWPGHSRPHAEHIDCSSLRMIDPALSILLYLLPGDLLNHNLPTGLQTISRLS